MKYCSVEDCTNKYYAKGFCRKHYGHNLRHGTPETLAEIRHMDEINRKYGKLTVKQIFLKNGDYYAKCICDCGNKCDVRLTFLHNKRTTSCGCKKNVNLKNIKNFSDTIYELLSEKQKMYYYDYFINELTYQQIAIKHGVTRQAIGKVMKNISSKICNVA